MLQLNEQDKLDQEINARKKLGGNGGSLLGNIAKCVVNLGAKTLFKRGVNTVSKALSSEMGKTCS